MIVHYKFFLSIVNVGRCDFFFFFFREFQTMASTLDDSFLSRGVNVRPNPRTRHEPNTGFFGLGLGLNGFGS